MNSPAAIPESFTFHSPGDMRKSVQSRDFNQFDPFVRRPRGWLCAGTRGTRVPAQRAAHPFPSVCEVLENQLTMRVEEGGPGSHIVEAARVGYRSDHDADTGAGQASVRFGLRRIR
jgi:hypothetical protein